MFEVKVIQVCVGLLHCPPDGEVVEVPWMPFLSCMLSGFSCGERPLLCFSGVCVAVPSRICIRFGVPSITPDFCAGKV